MDSITESDISLGAGNYLRGRGRCTMKLRRSGFEMLMFRLVTSNTGSRAFCQDINRNYAELFCKYAELGPAHTLTKTY